MGRTDCTEPQCLYKGDLYLHLLWCSFSMPQRYSSEDANLNTSCSLSTCNDSRSQWPRALRRASAADGFLGLRVRILPNAWMSWVSLLSVRGLCGGLITRPEDAYGLWRAVVYDKATSRMRRQWPALVSPLILVLHSWKSQRRAKQRGTDNFPRELITTRETQNTCACNVLRIFGY
jgi:hypothetical protein